MTDIHLTDIGVSAFRGKNVKSGALRIFLDAVEKGTVPPGSFLLVESLDRVTREDLFNAVTLFLNIINLGVKIVTLFDQECFDRSNLNLTKFTLAITTLARAYEESATKSRRLTAAWKNKKNNANTKILTAMCPLWLQLSKDRTHFEVRREAANTVVRIFEECSQGIGLDAIERRFNRERVPPLGKSTHWHKSYIFKILENRAVVGEFQPGRRENGKRTPDGEPIPDYYPRIISDELFYRAQDARRLRGGKGGGRKGREITNLFSRLAVCEYCNYPMRIINKGLNSPKGGTYLACSKSVRGIGCTSVRIKYDIFERSFLELVSELNIQSFLPESNADSKRLSKLENELSAINAQIDEKKDRIRALYSDMANGAGVANEIRREKADALGLEADQLEKNKASLSEEKDRLATRLASFFDGGTNIKEVVLSLQNRSAQNIYETRALLAQKISAIVDKIIVKNEGQAPTVRSYISQLDDLLATRLGTKQRAEYIRNLGEMRAMLKEPETYQKSYCVEFKDGSYRYVDLFDRGEVEVGSTTSSAQIDETWNSYEFELIEDGVLLMKEINK